MTRAFSRRLISSGSSDSSIVRRTIAGRVRSNTRILPRHTPAETGMPRKSFSPVGKASGMDDSYLNLLCLKSNSWPHKIRAGAMKKQKINDRCGLLSGGNWIVDQVKLV